MANSEPKIADLIMARRELADKVRETYSPNNYPGSKAWTRNQAAIDALAQWDTEHPDVVAEIERRRAAQAQSRMESISPVTGGDL